MSEGVDDGFCIHVDDGDGDGPSAESVDECKEVVKAVGVWHRNQVDVDMLEAFRRDCKLANWRHDVSLNFGLLTGKALPSPFADILFDVGPYKLVSYGLSSTLYSRMAEAMDDIEDSSAIGEGNKRSGWPIRNINK